MYMMGEKSVVALLLRLGLAAVFIYHGLDLVNKQGGMGWNPNLPVPAQIAVAWGELIGGIALALGFLTRVAALGIAIIMVGAIYTVHWEKGFSNSTHDGYEFNFVLIVMCICLMILGGGAFAVDALFGIRLGKRRRFLE